MSTIIKGIKKAEVIILQIFDQDYEVDQEKLYDILQYVDSNICCDLLHMSFGVISCSNIAKLEDLCASIHHKGTIIVSAYNNEGAISYPAFFNCVIGVDSFHVQYGRKYTYIENSPINIQVNIGVKRITVDGVPHLFTGSSFSSAYISNIILTQLLRDPETNIYHYLKMALHGHPPARLVTAGIHFNHAILPLFRPSPAFAHHPAQGRALGYARPMQALAVANRA